MTVYVALVQAQNVYIWTLLPPIEADSRDEAARIVYAGRPDLRGRLLLVTPRDAASTHAHDGTPLRSPLQGRPTIAEHYRGHLPKTEPDEAPEIGDASEFDEPPTQRPALRLLQGGKLPPTTPKETP